MSDVCVSTVGSMDMLSFPLKMRRVSERGSLVCALGGPTSVVVGDSCDQTALPGCAYRSRWLQTTTPATRPSHWRYANCATCRSVCG